jgi:hypothetical protein
MLEERKEKNKLRHIILDAEKRDVITKQEVGFIVTLVERFRNDIESKSRKLSSLQGEISQLRINEKIIMDLVGNMVSAAERDVARQETMAKLKGAREEEARFKKKQAELEEAKTPDEQED